LLTVVLLAIPCAEVRLTLWHFITTVVTNIYPDWDSIKTGAYTLYNNLWGKGAATSGSQCTTLDKVSGSVLSWHSAWSWAGGQYSVKSYPNVVVVTQDVQIAKIKSIDTTWKWSYTGQNLVTNVAYDAFTSSTPDGPEEYELMVWLGNFNAGPIAR
jgi:xyloglucan-specific endo-beta-1,4-glucanase